MVVGIISGNEGSGKTTQLIKLAKAYPKAYWILLELKDIPRLKQEASKDFEVHVAYKTYPKGHEKAFMVDPIATLNTVNDCKNAIFEAKPKTIIIDGISDLRDYSISTWVLRHNKETGEHVTGPKYKDWGSWGDINDLTRTILEPLINFALMEGRNLFMTAQMRDEYVNDTKVGYASDTKPWMTYPTQVLLMLSRVGSEYKIECEKEPHTASWVEEGVEQDSGLLKALVKHNLLESTEKTRDMTKEKKEYMVRFKLEDVQKKKFLVATSPEEAEATLKAMYEEAEEIEVIE